jgi:hypothetical protein
VSDTDAGVQPPDLARRAVAEALGTALLLAAVVGSGIMGERLAGGNAAIALLANTIATGAALVALILAFGPVSGAHFDPAVTLADAWRRGASWRAVAAYVAAQFVGAYAGVVDAQLVGAFAATASFRWFQPAPVGSPSTSVRRRRRRILDLETTEPDGGNR